jgi:adenine-specific DNA-methyltransferase
LDYAIIAPDGTKILPIGEKGKAFWLWSKDKVERERHKLKFQKDKSGNWKVYKKVYASDAIVSSSIILESKIVKGNTNGTAVLKSIFDSRPFDNPKSVELIKYLIQRADKTDASTILDFFAGSGTTGQAVLELNKEDGGKRQFILATANEITDTTPNGIVNDVTSKRLKRVMTGECYDGTKDFKWNEKNKPLGDNLDVYDIATVANFEATKDKTPFDVIDETLYGKEKLGVKEKIQWVCENFEGTQKTLENK